MAELNQYIESYQKETQDELAKCKQSEKGLADDKTVCEESIARLESLVGLLAHLYVL